VAESGRDQKPTENIFRIMDEIVYQLNNSKRLLIIMIVATIVVVPVTHFVTFALLGDSFPEGDFPRDRFGPPQGARFGISQAVVIAIVLLWVGIGIRQWLILSKWTKKYRQYKELQKRIDEKLDSDEEDGQPGKS
jgi:flagellar basal body-associated protein FliL